MTNNKHTPTLAGSCEVQRLVMRATGQGITLDTTSAKALASLGTLASTRKLDGACRLIRAGRDENLEVDCRVALRRIDTCGGNVEEAIRRTLTGGLEVYDGIAETVQYAAHRGVTLAPHSVYGHFRKRGRSGTRRYLDKLGAIMDAASMLGVDCTQARATQRLSRAEEDARRVISDFAAEQRRRSDRQGVTCRVAVPPRALSARSNAFAGCGCARCRDRLAAHMEHYIGKMIATPLFSDLDRDEARAEANLELIRSIETWPGGNFTGWFAARLTNRMRSIYKSRCFEEKQTLSLDAPGVLSDDQDGRIVPLGERIPDRSVDVLTIVLLREQLAEAALEQRQVRADRGDEFTRGGQPKPEPSVPSRPLRGIPHTTKPLERVEATREEALGRAA